MAGEGLFAKRPSPTLPKNSYGALAVSDGKLARHISGKLRLKHDFRKKQKDNHCAIGSC